MKGYFPKTMLDEDGYNEDSKRRFNKKIILFVLNLQCLITLMEMS